MNAAVRPSTKEKNVSDQAVEPKSSDSAKVTDLASRNAYPMVASQTGRGNALSTAAGVVAIGILGIVTFWTLTALSAEKERAPLTTTPQQSSKPANPFAAPVPLPTRPIPALANAQAAPPLPGPAPILAAPPRVVPAVNPYNTPTVVFDASALPAPVSAPLSAPGVPTDKAAKGDAASDFASRIGGVGGGPAQARADFNPQTTITQGTMIPAILETAIDTDVPGYVRAIVSQDVRSFDGSRVLVPRASRLVGQYQSGVQGGQKRAYVIWTRLIRSDGVSVALASPATGFDGSTGIAGKVDSHFFQRFGSALLLSVVGGLSAIGTGGSSLVLGGGESAAAAAVNQGGHTAATIRVHMGEPIRVFTARDLDFSEHPQQ